MSVLGREVSLSEVCVTITYGYTASATNTNTETKFLRITDIVPSQIDWESVPYCEINSNNLVKYKLQVGDIVIARTGATTGWNKTIKSLPYPTVFASYLIKYSINKEIADPFYVGYNLRSSQWYDYVDAIAGGSAQPGANAKQLGSFNFILPPINEQRAIASVLSSLDDKINLLYRQNKTLESMAETLFRHWFEMDSNDEWQEKNVLDIFTLVGGGTPKTSVAEYWTDEIPWISGGDISASHQGYLYCTEKYVSLAGIQNSSAKLLPKNSTIISARGTVGKYALLAENMAFSQSNYGIVSKIGNYPFFIYLLVGFIVDDLLAAAYGSVFDTITTRTFESVNLKLPSLNSIEKFNNEVTSIFNKKEKNTFQIQTLEKIRDTLLPKLMSGEVRVQYAEEAIASVA